MHCDRCNVDFPEGLRYCKWCGEALVDRPRVTSELHSCPTCAAAIQPGWTFCKACGERLQTGARKPAGCPRCGAENEAGAPKCSRCGEDLNAPGKSADSTDTSAIALCSSCGERLDTGSLYCKACGSAVYTEQKPFGGSALLCGACKSYSPLGSRECRVCGASLAPAARTVVDFPAVATTVQQKAPTLPDLDQEIAKQTPPAEEPIPNSGANTVVFPGSEASAHPRGSVETNVLPGTAGAKSEQQAPTQVMHMGRITGPVETDEVPENSNASGELAKESGGLNASPAATGDSQAAGGERTIQMAAVPQPTTPPGPTTLGLASESESENAPIGSENKTAVFVSRPQPTAPAPREPAPPAPAPPDDIGTREITASEQWRAQEPTREMQQPAESVTADRVASAGYVPRPTAEQIASAPRPSEIDVEPAPFGQVVSQPPPPKRTGMMIASVVVGLLLLAGAGYVGWLLFGRGKPAPVAPPVAQPVAPEPPPAPEKPPAPVVPEGMVAVVAGAYTIGRDGADPLEQPEHKVNVAAFFIDRAEVTNSAYKKFIDATSHKPPSNWTGANFAEGHGDFPVTGVTWQDAADYAAWAGKRLPTEVEWEAAARGPEGRIYPWGNDFRSGAANTGSKPDRPVPEQYPAGIKATGRYPDGASPAGAVDMIGNAWEWVADEIDVYPGNVESKLDLEAGITYRVIRGGAYDGSKVNDATYRGYLDGSKPYPKVGFRCAKNAK